MNPSVKIALVVASIVFALLYMMLGTDYYFSKAGQGTVKTFVDDKGNSEVTITDGFGNKTLCTTTMVEYGGGMITSCHNK